MKQKITFAWILLLLSLFSTTTYAQDGAVPATVTQSVRLRGGPGTDWVLLASLETGAAFTIDGRAPGGGWVRGVTADGKLGWVVETAVSLNADQLNALPSVWVDSPSALAGAAPAADQPAAPAAEAPPEGGLLLATANTVKLRAAPSTDGQVITTLAAGTQFSAVGRDASQAWVRGVLGGGTAGWISAQFVVITPEQMVNLPVTDAAGSSAAAPPDPAGDPAVPTPEIPGYPD